MRVMGALLPTASRAEAGLFPASRGALLCLEVQGLALKTGCLPITVAIMTRVHYRKMAFLEEGWSELGHLGGLEAAMKSMNVTLMDTGTRCVVISARDDGSTWRSPPWGFSRQEQTRSADSLLSLVPLAPANARLSPRWPLWGRGCCKWPCDEMVVFPPGQVGPPPFQVPQCNVRAGSALLHRTQA